ncbi:MAG: hypothetical protein H6Q11_970 [Acidobacteria bacterium]|nr:hypothetical protein [Acidobacteriota bacterium]
MAEPLVFISTCRLKEGKLEDYRRLSRKITDLVETGEPDMVHFGFFVDDETNEVTTLQVHRSAENMARHMQLVAAPHLKESAEILDYSTMRIALYGAPTEAVLTQVRQLAGTGASVSINSPVAAFGRFG